MGATLRALSVSAFLLIIWTPVPAQEPSDEPEARRAEQPKIEEPKPEQDSDAKVQEKKKKPAKKPKYGAGGVRYNDDFSYLDDPPEDYEESFFDPIKNIRLDDDWRLSIGGEVRLRMEAETNKAFDAATPTQDTFLLHHQFLHFDLKYKKAFRVFGQGVNAMIEDRDRRLLPIHENRFDVHQLFADIRILGEEVPLTLRVGRQELIYGRQRLISPLGWANTRRRFDAVKLFWQDETWNADFFYARPVPISLGEKLHRKPDEFDEDAHFYGAYFTYKGIKDHGIDAYFLALRNTSDLLNANGKTGDRSLYTVGGRFWGKTGPWDYETELSGQWGKFASDPIQAWSWAADTGWTFSDFPWSPRIGVGFDYATGDDLVTDNRHQTFNQLFPLGHAYMGYMDVIARQNVAASNVNLTLKPHNRVTARVAYHTFWLDETNDALYNAGGVATRRDLSGNVGHEVGHELDLTVKWAMDAHSTWLFGYSHFWASDFVQQTGRTKDADFYYVQYGYKF
jgi:hypothetical protein